MRMIAVIPMLVMSACSAAPTPNAEETVNTSEADSVDENMAMDNTSAAMDASDNAVFNATESMDNTTDAAGGHSSDPPSARPKPRPPVITK